MSDFEAQQISLAQRIAAAKRGGEGPMPSDEELKQAIDAIRAKRAEYQASSKRKPKADTAGGAEPTKAAVVSSLNLDEMGI